MDENHEIPFHFHENENENSPKNNETSLFENEYRYMIFAYYESVTESNMRVMRVSGVIQSARAEKLSIILCLITQYEERFISSGIT